MILIIGEILECDFKRWKWHNMDSNKKRKLEHTQTFYGKCHFDLYTIIKILNSKYETV